MTNKLSGSLSGASNPKHGGKRQPTRFPGVYQRNITNKRTSKADIAYDITYSDTQGKQRWLMIGYRSDGVNAPYANQRRGEIIAGVSRGEQPSRKNSGMTFSEGWAVFVEKWLRSLVSREGEKRYNRYIQKRLGHRRLNAVTTLELEEIKADLLRTLSPASVQLILSDIRRMYKKLAVWGVYTGKIPTDGLKMPRADNVRTRFLTREEAVNLLKKLAQRSRTWHDIAFLSLYTGMRKGEILALRGEHLDFDGKRILVKDAKTGSRTVYLTEDVHALLMKIRPRNPGDYIFEKRGGGRISYDSDESFIRAVADCGLNNGITDNRHKVVFHTLRHTFCSWLAISGVPLYTIGELVGHKSLEMTQRYSHLCPDAKQEAASQIGVLMRKAMTDPHQSSSFSAPQDTAAQRRENRARAYRP